MFIETLNKTPLAITEAKLSEITIFIDSYLKGENKPIKNEHVFNISVVDKIAIVPIYGFLAKRMNLLTQFSGGTSTEQLSNSLIKLNNDTKIDAIVLDVDSPGGTVDGTTDLVNIIDSIIQNKPVIAYANGQMTSKAYWISSAATAIISNPLTLVGSVGVIAPHYDYSESDKQSGLKRTFIYKGKKKGLGNDAEPLSEDGYNEIMSMVDKYHTMFLDYVTQKRQLSLEQSASVGESGIYIGQDAVDIGLCDGIGTLYDAVEIAKYIVKDRRSMMTLEELKSENLVLYDQIFKSGYEKGKIEMQASIQDTVQKERERCTSIVEMTDDEIVIKAVKEGKDTGTFYKEKLLTERKNRAAIQDNLLQISEPVTMTKFAHKTGKEDIEQFNLLVSECVKIGMAKSAAIKKVKLENPELYNAYCKEVR